jgi:hypothetical protein
VPLLAGVAARGVRKIAAQGSTASFNARTRIVSAGDPGDAFYVGLVGRAEVQAGRGRPEPAVAHALLRALAGKVRELDALAAD